MLLLNNFKLRNLVVIFFFFCQLAQEPFFKLDFRTRTLSKNWIWNPWWKALRAAISLSDGEFYEFCFFCILDDLRYLDLDERFRFVKKLVFAISDSIYILKNTLKPRKVEVYSSFGLRIKNHTRNLNAADFFKDAHAKDFFIIGIKDSRNIRLIIIHIRRKTVGERNTPRHIEGFFW